MECPFCHHRIGYFSKAVNSLNQRARKCPACGKAFILKLNKKKYWAFAIPLLIVALTALQLLPPHWLNLPVAVGIVVGISMFFSLKPIEPEG
ncbi:hypothetical protein LLG95_11685 [bacterium]|nr:hypothetical protein [bacterium]